jgi:hypothetical protein
VPFLALILPALNSAVSFAATFAQSRVGQILIAAGLAFVWGHHIASASFEAREAQARAQLVRAHEAEVVREVQAAQEIAAAATARAASDAEIIKSQDAAIHQLELQEASKVHANAHAKTGGPCFIDGAFADSVRQFDTINDRTPLPPKRPKRLR